MATFQSSLLKLSETDLELTSIHAIEVQILQGDCIEILKTLEPRSINCCVTSPPYLGLRDYGTASWIGGDIDCEHKNPKMGKPTWGEGSTGSSTLIGKPSNDSHSLEGFKGKICPLCGAKRVDSQIGLEQTPDEYIKKLVAVFREVRRVLRNDGTLWVNIGSSYAGSGMQSDNPGGLSEKQLTNHGSYSVGFGGKRPNQPLHVQHVLSCDNDDKEPVNSQGFGISCLHFDDVCQGDFQSHRDCKFRNAPTLHEYDVPPCTINHDSEHWGSVKEFLVASFLGAQASTSFSCTHCGQGASSPEDGVEVFPSVIQTFSSDVLPSFHKGQSKNDKSLKSLTSAYHKLGKGSFSLASHPPVSNGSISSSLPTMFHNVKFKPKDLIPIPWMLAMALQADGWYLRSDIIWCLSGGTWVYARTQKGDMPMMIRDMYRLDPKTVKLWNGKKWTQLLGMSKSQRRGDEIEIVLRSGERISCTPSHKFPTTNGLKKASDINSGDCLTRACIPSPDKIKNPKHIDSDLGWFIGLYLAEGSRSGTGRALQIAGHVKKQKRWERVCRIAESYGGSATKTINGNNMNIRVYGRFLHSAIDEFISGRVAKDKGFSPVIWRYQNTFIKEAMMGYLDGDGSWDAPNNRWRLGFTRNYKLEQDLRTACARLGWKIILKFSQAECNGKSFPSFRGEIRINESNHWNVKNSCEIMEIRKARARYFYDLGVESEPHVFALASGILTHNSKPAPMPESVKDRPTKAHEYVFLLSKSQKYFYDADAISETATTAGKIGGLTPYAADAAGKPRSGNMIPERGKAYVRKDTRNKRSVWTVNTKSYKEAHFATFPEALITPMIKAGCPVGGTVLDPFFGSGTTGLVSRQLGRQCIGIELNPEYCKIAKNRLL